MKEAVGIIGIVIALLVIVGGVLWVAKTASAKLSAASVHTQVITIEGACYIVVTSTDGVAVCPAVKP